MHLAHCVTSAISPAPDTPESRLEVVGAEAKGADAGVVDDATFAVDEVDPSGAGRVEGGHAVVHGVHVQGDDAVEQVRLIGPRIRTPGPYLAFHDQDDERPKDSVISGKGTYG